MNSPTLSTGTATSGRTKLDQPAQFSPDVIAAGDRCAQQQIERAVFFFAGDRGRRDIGDDQQDDREFNDRCSQEKLSCLRGVEPSWDIGDRQARPTDFISLRVNLRRRDH